MDTKWTPGPWVANDLHQGVGWRVESDASGYPNDGWVIASDMMGPDNKANAHLIASAPDLYGRLDDLVGLLATTGFHNSIEMAAARAVLRAARGETA